MGKLLAVNVVHELLPALPGKSTQTAIDKRPVAGRVPVWALGVEGDTQGDRSNHGGLDQAVYAYAAEDAAWWAGELGRDLPPGRFGENFTTEDLDITGALIGEKWRVGTAVFQVRSPRIPCRTFQEFWEVPQLVKRFTERALPGAYLRVLVEGEVGAGDEIEVFERPVHDLTVEAYFRAWTIHRAEIGRIADCPDVPGAKRAEAEVLRQATARRRR
jgi:MOSC domain-containing protein YiiM